jgi:hypothetical protein
MDVKLLEVAVWVIHSRRQQVSMLVLEVEVDWLEWDESVYRKRAMMITRHFLAEMVFSESPSWYIC